MEQIIKTTMNPNINQMFTRQSRRLQLKKRTADDEVVTIDLKDDIANSQQTMVYI